MCGIAGFLHFDKEQPADFFAIKRMTDAMSYRGPDGEGHFVNSNIALGHRRLSIIDLSTGDQPMFSVDKNVALVFNGEIYNYIELREELKLSGHQFRTNSDAEVIIEAYLEWGTECLKRFNGMWALALWDNRNKQLFIARDRIGEKPLHYALTNNTLIFGSEIKCIFAYGFKKIPDNELLEIYLTLGYIPAPFTFFKDIRKLKAGHYLLVREKAVKEIAYWELPEIDEADMITDRKKVFRDFEDLLKDSVRIRMRSDVPYGAFLSGGLDSSSIVALMSEISSYPVETFTIGFHEKSYDERNLAIQVAERFNTCHHEHIIEPEIFDSSLNNTVYHYDEPFGDPSAIPTGHVAKFAVSKVKMVLTGDGGDEVLSGYTYYQGEKFSEVYRKLPGIARTGLPVLVKQASRLLRGDQRYRLNRIQDVFSASNQSFEDRYLSKTSRVEIPLIKLLLTGGDVYPVEEFISDRLKECSYQDPFYKLMFLDLKLSLPDDMLAKVDRMSMAYSLETRTPFLDHRIIEYMAHVHKDLKMISFERKSVLRRSIGNKLPEALLQAPKKGFSVPLREWFKGDSFTDYLNKLEFSTPYLNRSIVQDITEMNRTGKRDYGDFIWMLLVCNKIYDD